MRSSKFSTQLNESISHTSRRPSYFFSTGLSPDLAVISAVTADGTRSRPCSRWCRAPTSAGLGSGGRWCHHVHVHDLVDRVLVHVLGAIGSWSPDAPAQTVLCAGCLLIILVVLHGLERFICQWICGCTRGCCQRRENKCYFMDIREIWSLGILSGNFSTAAQS